MTSQLANGEQQFLDSNGDPLASGSVYFYIPTTTTFKNTWQDINQTVLNANPVVLDAAGRAIVFGSGAYRQLVKDVNGNTIWDQLTYGTTQQVIPVVAAGGTGDALTATFSPPVLLVDGTIVGIQLGAANTLTNPTLNVNSTGVLTIVRGAGSALIAGDLPGANALELFEYSGNLNEWVLLNPAIGLAGAHTVFDNVAPQFTVAVNEAQGTDVTSAATIVLDSATGNYVHVTGVVNISAITLAQGRQRIVDFTGILTLVNGASLILPTAANITTAAGDTACFVGEAAGVVRCVWYQRASGQSLSATQINNLVVLQEQQASGTSQNAGVAYVVGAWRTGIINQKPVDTGAICTLAANQFSLPAGSFTLVGFACVNGGGGQTNNGRLRLRNITAGTTVVEGTNTVSLNTLTAGIVAQFTVAGATTFELQVFPTTNGATVAAGALTTGDVEIYLSLEIRQYA